MAPSSHHLASFPSSHRSVLSKHIHPSFIDRNCHPIKVTSDLFPLVSVVLKKTRRSWDFKSGERQATTPTQAQKQCTSGAVCRVFDKDGKLLREADRVVCTTCSLESEDSCSEEWDFWHAFFDTRCSCSLYKLKECKLSLFGDMQPYYIKDANVSNSSHDFLRMGVLASAFFYKIAMPTCQSWDDLEEKIPDDGIYVRLEFRILIRMRIVCDWFGLKMSMKGHYHQKYKWRY